MKGGNCCSQASICLGGKKVLGSPEGPSQQEQQSWHKLELWKRNCLAPVEKAQGVGWGGVCPCWVGVTCQPFQVAFFKTMLPFLPYEKVSSLSKSKEWWVATRGPFISE